MPMDARRVLRSAFVLVLILLLGAILAAGIRSSRRSLQADCGYCYNEDVVLVDDGRTLSAIPCAECAARRSPRALASAFLDGALDVRRQVGDWGRRNPEEVVFLAGGLLYLGVLLALSWTLTCRACSGSGADGGEGCGACGGLGQQSLLERLSSPPTRPAAAPRPPRAPAC